MCGWHQQLHMQLFGGIYWIFVWDRYVGPFKIGRCSVKTMHFPSHLFILSFQSTFPLSSCAFHSHALFLTCSDLFYLFLFKLNFSAKALMTAWITHAQTVDRVWMESTITLVAAWQVIPGITARKVRSSIIPFFHCFQLLNLVKCNRLESHRVN